MSATAALAAFALQTCDAVDVDVHSAGLAKQIAVEADSLRWVGDPCAGSPVLRLEVFQNGQVAARYTVRPSLTVWVEGWVAGSDAEAGDLVEAVRGRFVLDRSTQFRVPSEGPWRATSAVPAGAPLTRTVVAEMPDLVRGTEVRLRVRRGPVVLTAPGRLLHDGSVGDTVRVQNAATHAAIAGVLTSLDIVEIR